LGSVRQHEGSEADSACSDHLCLISEDLQDQNRALIPLLKSAIQAQASAVCISDADSATSLVEALSGEGIDLGGASFRGVLKLIEYSSDGENRKGSDSDNLLTLLEQEATNAAKDAQESVRLFIDMAACLTRDRDKQSVIECEARLSDFCRSHDVALICLYDKTSFAPGVIADVIRCHPQVFLDCEAVRNFCHREPRELLAPPDDDKEAERLLENLASLQRWRQELEQTLKAKDEFLGLVSHELKTPITVILGNAALLERGLSLPDDELKQMYHDIRHDAERLNRIITNLLALARLERGRKAEAEPLLLHRIVNQVVKEHRRLYPEREINLKLADEPRPAIGDRTYMEQVILNVLSNAEKYSPADAPIEVEVETSADEHARISVADGGKGISPAEMERIFEAFYRSSSARGTDGVGIGLTVCERLMSVQGGRIWAESREKGGTVFYLEMPVATANVG
jgi:signal transduction histidine kinase